MFCDKCGEKISDDWVFCRNCGARVKDYEATVSFTAKESAASTVPMGPAAPPAEAAPKKVAGDFFSSPAGTALVIIIGIAVIAGITLGIIFAVRGGGGGDEAVNAATVEVWYDYEKLLEDNSEAFPQITTDPAYVANTVKEIEKTVSNVEALEKAVGTTQSVKAQQLEKALAAYRSYVEKMKELFNALSGANLLDQNTVSALNDIIADMDKLGDRAKDLANEFLADNDDGWPRR